MVMVMVMVRVRVRVRVRVGAHLLYHRRQSSRARTPQSPAPYSQSSPTPRQVLPSPSEGQGRACPLPDALEDVLPQPDGHLGGVHAVEVAGAVAGLGGAALHLALPTIRRPTPRPRVQSQSLRRGIPTQCGRSADALSACARTPEPHLLSSNRSPSVAYFRPPPPLT